MWELQLVLSVFGFLCLMFLSVLVMILYEKVKTYESFILGLFKFIQTKRNSQLKRLRKQDIDIIANAKAHAIVDVLNFQKEYYFEDPRIKKLLIREKLYD